MSQPQPKPDGNDFGALWSALKQSCSTEQAAFLDELAARATGPVGSIEDLIVLLKSDEEYDRLAAIAEGITGYSAAEVAYAQHKNRARQRQADLSAKGREIGPLPRVTDPALKEQCRYNLKLYLEKCFPEAFRLGWSKNHLKVIRKLEAAILHGGKFALAMPRGRGKTTIFVRAILWAICFGHHRYALLVAANDDKAAGLLEGLKRELRFNVQLFNLFPEICFPIRCLEGIANRAAGQVLDGLPTQIGWVGSQLVLPTVAGSESSGAIIECGGLLTALRGAQYVTQKGEVLRPTLVMLDDPQTRESAHSVEQTRTRYGILSADLAGLAGPDQKLSVCAAVTCIAKGDLSDTILDRKKCPEYRAERLRMVIRFPDNMDLWEQYFELRRQAFNSDDDTVDTVAAQAATDFYAANREAMDAGAEIDWETAISKGDLTALQTAMNFLCEDEDSFWSERQNEPRNLFDVEEDFATADAIAIKVSGYNKRAVPIDVEYVTAFIDVHQRVLLWGLCGFSPTFDGYILDYGVYPKQRRKHFVQSRARPTLLETYKGKGKEGAIYKGLEDLTGALFDLKLVREDGAEMPINRMLIDANWQTKTVNRFIRESPTGIRGRMTPSFGKGYAENDTPISKFIPRVGEHVGDEWYSPALKTSGALRHVIFDANFWKTFVHRRLATSKGDRGCLTVFGQVGKTQHDHLADHLTAEFRTIRHGRRRADVWALKPRTTENHWLDVIVGCHVAGSICGAEIAGLKAKKAAAAARGQDPAGGDDRVQYPDAA